MTLSVEQSNGSASSYKASIPPVGSHRLQVASLTLAIIWTLYQFTRARRLNEGEVEDWIEEHLDDKPRNLMNERGEYLLLTSTQLRPGHLSHAA